jgi:hypothetical protein
MWWEMKRSDLEKRAITALEEEGYTCERAYNKAVFIPGKGYIGKRFDFFHVVDIIAIKNSEIRFIQVTSEEANPNSKHHSKSGSDSIYMHKEKIKKFWKPDIPIELWTYSKINARWKLSIEVYRSGMWDKNDILEVEK